MLWNLWTGEKDPYSHIASHGALTLHLAQGGRPTFPASAGGGGGGGGGVAEVAALAARCWAERSQDRPSFVEIHRDLVIWGSGDAAGGGGGAVAAQQRAD
jgi:hypothetical protein